ncbi:MAG: phosphatase PAP2 family protein [Gammaproteobacteria bacterium]|nr:phosphatase PAP2 family protein [Gammaproteobacteria bacterium]
MTAIQPASVWKTYAFWAMWVGVAFFSVYPTCNWLTSLRGEYFSLYFAAELDVPFVPEFIVFYLSMYALFAMPPFFLKVTELTALGKQLIAGTLISGLVFLLVPARLGFVREVPESGLIESIYSTLFAVDMPHNMVPSLHVVFSTLILLALANASAGEHNKILWYGWLMVICGSTLLVHQHHLIDVVAGLALAFALRRIIVKREEI